MGETIKVDVLVTDNGSTAQATNNAKALNTELQKVQRTASQTSAALKAAAATRPSGAMSQAQDDDIASYRTARGIGGSTGAEGRDFARQAQGLGGLVHVYATFAANLFAVSAAFNALSKAADTTNMVKGLDQLGAASGRALGSMAQNITKITDGAISLRSAMRATAQATAGGLSGQQFERLTKVAQKASQALGRDMEDALSRLTRGVVKIEPELLDELGIMTRVDAATREYARTLGKTATSLTDFEKRQAFAIAAIEEGERKFADINLDATPYQKLLASFSNLAIKGGELLNTVLGPIVKLLAESPTALSLVIAGISTMLLSRAIPAISQWKKGLLESSKAAAASAKSLRDNFEQFQVDKFLAPGKLLESQADKLKNSFQKVIYDTFATSSKIYKEAIDNNGPLSQATIEALDKQQKAINTRLKGLTLKAGGLVSPEEASALDKQITQLNKRNEAIDKAKKLASEEIALRARANTVLDEGVDKASEKTKFYEAYAIRKRLADQADIAAAKSQILYNTTVNTQQKGMAEAFRALRKEVSQMPEATSRFTKGLTLIQGSASIAASETMRLASSLSNVFAAAGIVLVVLSVLGSWFSKNSKLVEEFDNSIQVLDNNVQGAARTFELISKKDLLGKISAQSTQSVATAFNELSDAITKVSTGLDRADAAASWFDRMMDNLKVLINSDLRSQATKGMSAAISQALKAPIPEKDKEEFKAKIATVLGQGFDSSVDGISEVFSKLSNSELKTAFASLSIITEEFNTKINNSASSLTAFNEVTKATEKSLQDLTLSYIPKDASSKFAVDQMNQAKALADAAKDARQGVQALALVVTDFNKLKLFPPETAEVLQKNKAAILSFTSAVKGAEQDIPSLENALEELKEEAKGLQGVFSGEDRAFNLIRQGEIQKAIDYLKQAKLDAEKDLASLTIIVNNTIRESYASGVDRLARGFEQAAAAAALSIQKAAASAIQGPGMAELQGKFQQQEISLRAQQIEIEKQLIISQKQLVLSNERRFLEEKQARGENVSAKAMKDILDQQDLLDKMSKKGFDRSILSDFKTANVEVQKGLDTILAGYVGIAQKSAEIYGQAAVAKLQTQLAIHKEEQQTLNNTLDIQLKKIENEQAYYDLIKSSTGTYSEVIAAQERDLIIRKASIEDQKLLNEEIRIQKDGMVAIAALSSTEDKKKATIALAAAMQLIEEKRTENRIKLEIELDKREQERRKASAEYEQKIHQMRMDNAKLESDIQVSNLDKQEQALEAANNMYKLDKVAYNETKAQISIEKQHQKYLQDSLSLQIEKEKEITSIVLRRSAAQKALSEADFQHGTDSTEYKAAYDILVNINKEEALINEKYALRQQLIESNNEASLRSIEYARQYGNYAATWKPFIDGIGSALEEGLKVGLEKGAMEGGKTFIQILKDQLKKAVFNIVINAMVNPVMNALTGAVSGQGSNGLGLLQTGMGAYNTYNNATSGATLNSNLGVNTGDLATSFSTSSMGQALGLSTPVDTAAYTGGQVYSYAGNAPLDLNSAGQLMELTDTGTNLANTASAAGNASFAQYAPYISALFMAANGQYGGAAGTAGGAYLASAAGLGPYGVAIAAILGGLLGGSLDGHKGGPKKEGNFRAGFDSNANLQDIGAFLGSTDGRENNLEHSETKAIRGLVRGTLLSAQALAGAYGSTIRDQSADMFFNTDPEGTAPDNVAGSVRDKNGNIVYKRIANVGRGEGGKELEGEAKRVILAMLKETDLVPAMNEYLDGLNISELSNDAASAALDLVSNFTSVIASLKMLGKTGEDITVSFKDMTKEQTEAFNTSMSHFNMLAWALGPTSERITSLADSLTTTGATLADFTTGVDNLFNEFLKGYDTSKMTTEELSSLIVTLKQTKDAINFVNKSLSGTLGLPKTLSDAAGGLDKLKEQVASYYELFFTDQEKSTNNFKSLSKEFDALNIKMPTSKEGFRNLVEGLDLTTDSGQATFTALMRLAPAFAAVADATQNIIDTVAQVRTRIAEMRFNMEYDTKDNAGKYAMLDDRADLLNKKMRSSTDIFEQASLANQLLDNINTAFALLNDDQKKAALPEYLDKLNSIDTFIQEQGIQALSELTPDGVRTVEAIQDSTAAIVEAITESDPTVILDKYFNSTNSSVQAALEKSPAAMADALDFAITNLLETTDTTGVMSQADIDAISGKLTDSISAKQAAAAATAGTEDDAAVTAEIQAITSAVTAMQGAMETINAAQASLDAALNAPATLQDGSLTPEAIQADIAAKTAQANEISAKQTEAQTQATEAITGLANNTLSLEQVINTLQTLATTLVAAAKTPVRVDVDVNVDTPATAEVGIG